MVPFICKWNMPRETESLGVSESVRGALVGFMLLEAVIGKVTKEDMIYLAPMTH